MTKLIMAALTAAADRSTKVQAGSPFSHQQSPGEMS
jgi:hypothetical protein